MSQDDNRLRPLETCLRLATILAPLHERPPLSILAEQLGVSRRTVLRHMYALERAGWRVPPVAEQHAKAQQLHRRRPHRAARRHA